MYIRLGVHGCSALVTVFALYRTDVGAETSYQSECRAEGQITNLIHELDTGFQSSTIYLNSVQ